MGKEREWLKDVLLNSSESSEEESTPEGKDRRIKTILKQRRLELKYVKRYRMKKTVRYVDLFVMFCTKIIFLCLSLTSLFLCSRNVTTCTTVPDCYLL